MQALTRALSAALRRALIVAFVSLVGYAIDAFPSWLRQGLESDPIAVKYLAAIWLAVEFAQKLLREWYASWCKQYNK